MHRFRQLLYLQMPLNILRLSILAALLLIYNHHSTLTVSPLLLDGFAESLINVASLTICTAAGVLALSKGVGLPVLWALSTTMGAGCIQLGIPLSALGAGLVVLVSGWGLVRKLSLSDAWVALSGAMACPLPFLVSQRLLPIPHGISLLWSTSETSVYLLGLFIGQITISLAAYQAAFWLFWHLGDRVNAKFYLGGLMACGTGLAYGWSTFLG